VVGLRGRRLSWCCTKGEREYIIGELDWIERISRIIK
jgi:hypothetical protein